jgi:hypothetical protein
VGDNVVKMPPSKDDPEGVELVLNSRYERQDDGTWTGTLAPLKPAPAGEPELPTLRVRAGSADEARSRLIAEYMSTYYGGEASDREGRLDFASHYGRWIQRKFLRSEPWPPERVWSNIDRIEAGATEMDRPE